jgi:hypothetical protein
MPQIVALYRWRVAGGSEMMLPQENCETIRHQNALFYVAHFCSLSSEA